MKVSLSNVFEMAGNKLKWFKAYINRPLETYLAELPLRMVSDENVAIVSSGIVCEPPDDFIEKTCHARIMFNERLTVYSVRGSGIDSWEEINGFEFGNECESQNSFTIGFGELASLDDSGHIIDGIFISICSKTAASRFIPNLSNWWKITWTLRVHQSGHDLPTGHSGGTDSGAPPIPV
jgi:hypothetical protein